MSDHSVQLFRSRQDYHEIPVACDCEICPEALDPPGQVGEVGYRHPPRSERLFEQIGDYTGWLCHAPLRVDEAVIERATKRKVIATCSTGTDHLDKPPRHSIQQSRRPSGPRPR